MFVTVNLQNQIFTGIPNSFRESGLGQIQRFRRISMHFRDSSDSLSELKIPVNIWFHRFAVTYTCYYTSYLQKLFKFRLERFAYKRGMEYSAPCFKLPCYLCKLFYFPLNGSHTRAIIIEWDTSCFVFHRIYHFCGTVCGYK